MSYLRSGGSALIDFERETSTLTSASALDAEICKMVQTRISNLLAGGKIFGLIRQVKDPVLNVDFSQDVNNKMRLLAQCAGGRREFDLDRPCTEEL